MKQQLLLKYLRDICIVLPEVSETIKWGNPTFEAGKKMFAVLDSYEGKLCIAFRSPLDQYSEILEDPRFFPAPYSARHGWICLRADSKLDPKELAILLKQSYKCVALKRMLKKLAEADQTVASKSRR